MGSTIKWECFVSNNENKIFRYTQSKCLNALHLSTRWAYNLLHICIKDFTNWFSYFLPFLLSRWNRFLVSSFWKEENKMAAVWKIRRRNAAGFLHNHGWPEKNLSGQICFSIFPMRSYITKNTPKSSHGLFPCYNNGEEIK